MPLFLSLSCTEIVPNVGNGTWCWGDARHVSESWMAVGFNFLEADFWGVTEISFVRLQTWPGITSGLPVIQDKR